MPNDKTQLLAQLRSVFDRWEKLLNGLSEAQIISPLLASQWSIKDVTGHLYAWQQISVARAQAALDNREPEFPAWWHKFAPDPDEVTDQVNAWNYETYRDKPWPAVYVDWRTQFLRYLELAQQIPEQDLLQPGRYPWMSGYAIADSLQGSFEHHEEHLGEVLTRLSEHVEK